MSLEILVSLLGFALVASITPGPNNIMLLASGVNFGFRRTIPHMLGVSFGFAIILICAGLGLGQLLDRAPLLYTGLKIAGGSYLLYLAYKIAMSGPVAVEAGVAKPMHFIAAAAFQWVNPKAWVMAVAAMAAYTDIAQYTSSALLVALIFSIVTLPSMTVWTSFGTGLRSVLSSPKYLRIFNIGMALLLVVSLWPLLR